MRVYGHLALQLPTHPIPTLSNLNANHLHGAQTKCMTGIGGPACDDIGPGLQLVVDDNGARANQPALCGLGGEVRQRQRISATLNSQPGQGHLHPGRQRLPQRCG